MNSLKIFTLIFFQFFFIYSFSQSNLIQNSEFTVVIDAGHGGKDPGAVAKTKLQEKNEYKTNTIHQSWQ